MPLLIQAISLSPTDSIVKIKSYYKSPSFPPRIGSGMIILWRSQKYILTSDHVIYHSNKSFIHEMTDAQGRNHFLTYLVSDAGKGLALLQLIEDEATSIPYSLDQINEPNPILFEDITMIGYPADSDAVLMNKKGKLNSIKYPSDLFIQISNLLEVNGGYGEFGMSGGGAFSTQGEYRGLISHQIIKNDSAISVLLIPAADIKIWLQNLFNSEGQLKSPSPIDLFQDPSQQVSEFLSYRTSNLYLSFSQIYGPGTPLGLTVFNSKNRVTDKIYGGDNGPFSNLFFKPDFNLICLGFRSAQVLGDLIPPPSTVNPWLRTAIDPTIELLWTYDGAGVITNVKKARTYQKDFTNFAKQINQANAPHLRFYLEKIAYYLEFTPNNNTIDDDTNESALGKWRLIKPKDLDFILNDPSLKDEWSNMAKISLDHTIKDKLIELKIIMQELTL